jgi:hypothetical protein
VEILTFCLESNEPAAYTFRIKLDVSNGRKILVSYLESEKGTRCIYLSKEKVVDRVRGEKMEIKWRESS